MNIDKNIFKGNPKKPGTSEHYWLRKQHAGKRHCIDLLTTNKKAALSRARALWANIIDGTANATLAKLKPAAPKLPATLGDVAEAYLASPTSPASQKSKGHNLAALWLMLREGAKITEPKKERASILTTSLIEHWIAYREKHKAGRKGKKPTPKQMNRARRTICSYVSQARSVFAASLLDEKFGAYRKLTLPDLTGFMKCPLPRAIKKLYTPPSTAEMAPIIAGLPDLEKENPAAFLCILLALGCGLRRGEIIKARWSMVDWDETGETRRPFIKLTDSSDWKGAKGNAERRVPIPPAIYAKLLKYQDTPVYLIPDENGKKKRRTRFDNPGFYRSNTSGANGLSADANRWMRSRGWKRRQGLHELRKYYGSMVATESGSLYATQLVLGHQDVNTTRDYYAGLLESPDYNAAIEKRLNMDAGPRADILTA